MQEGGSDSGSDELSESSGYQGLIVLTAKDQKHKSHA